MTVIFVAATGITSAAVTGCIRRSEPRIPANASVDHAATTIAALVQLVPGERHQTLEGFGASLAWHLDKVTRNPPPGIYEVIFPELGLDILRFRNRYQRSKPEDGDLSQEVEILRRATQALGHAPKIMLSSWSPPAPLKADRREDCNNNLDCTLARENYHARDQYYALKHYARFTDPGFVRVGARSDQPAIRASAYQSPSSDQITAVVLNTEPAPASVRIDAGGFAAARSATHVTAFHPGSSRVWQEVRREPGAAAKDQVVVLPPRSIATVVLWRSP